MGFFPNRLRGLEYASGGKSRELWVGSGANADVRLLDMGGSGYAVRLSDSTRVGIFGPQSL